MSVQRNKEIGLVSMPRVNEGFSSFQGESAQERGGGEVERSVGPHPRREGKKSFTCGERKGHDFCQSIGRLRPVKKKGSPTENYDIG